MTRPQLITEISFPSNPFDPPSWTDVSAFVQRLECRRGRSNERGTFEAGTSAIVLDNDDGRFTPGNTLSPYAADLRPMRRVRSRATWNGVTYALHSHFIERWPPLYPGGLVSETQLQAVDGTTFLSQEKINYSWGAESSHWRIHSMLNAIGWPSSERAIYTSGSDPRSGKSVVPAIALDGTPPLSHIREVTRAEDGTFFFNGAGQATFQGRWWRLAASRSTTAQATFGRDASAGELPYLRAALTYDDTFVINDVRLTRPGGVTQSASDATSRARYRTRSVVDTLQLTNDAEVAARAQWMVARNKEPQLRLASLEVSGLQNDALWPVILSLEISDRVAVVMRPPSSSVIRREYYVESIAHRVTASDWITTLSLSPASMPDGSIRQPLLFSNTSFGKIGRNSFGY